MNSYRMVTSHSCGPDALSFATGLDRREVLFFMKWPDTCDWQDNLKDYIGSHFKVLDYFKILHRLITWKDIESGNFKENSILILLHDYPNKVSTWLKSTLKQHWIVIHSVQEGKVLFHDGSGDIKIVSLEQMKNWYLNGSVNCGYIIGEGYLNTHKLEKTWDSFVNVILKIYSFF